MLEQGLALVDSQAPVLLVFCHPLVPANGSAVALSCPADSWSLCRDCTSLLLHLSSWVHLGF